MSEFKDIRKISDEMNEEIKMLKNQLREELVDFGEDKNFVVHLTPTGVYVDQDIHVGDNDAMIIKLNDHGSNHYGYFIVQIGTPDGDFILAKGNENEVRRQLRKIYNPDDYYSVVLTELFDTILDVLKEEE